jgi:hypothetical protein
MTEQYRPKGRIYLYPCAGPGGNHPFTCGTHKDLAAEGISPSPGMRLDFYSDDGNDAGEPDFCCLPGSLTVIPIPELGSLS